DSVDSPSSGFFVVSSITLTSFAKLRAWPGPEPNPDRNPASAAHPSATPWPSSPLRQTSSPLRHPCSFPPQPTAQTENPGARPHPSALAPLRQSRQRSFCVERTCAQSPFALPDPLSTSHRSPGTSLQMAGHLVPSQKFLARDSRAVSGIQ